MLTGSQAVNHMEPIHTKNSRRKLVTPLLREKWLNRLFLRWTRCVQASFFGRPVKVQHPVFGRLHTSCLLCMTMRFTYHTLYTIMLEARTNRGCGCSRHTRPVLYTIMLDLRLLEARTNSGYSRYTRPGIMLSTLSCRLLGVLLALGLRLHTYTITAPGWLKSQCLMQF